MLRNTPRQYYFNVFLCLAILTLTGHCVTARSLDFATAGDFVSPSPTIQPLISKAYSNDVNGNMIDDRLEQSAYRSTGLFNRTPALQLNSSLRRVELIFRAPVTREQVDIFNAMGGRILYMFKALSYGWEGMIPLDKVSFLPAAMGPELVLVEATRTCMLHMDLASQSGRVRVVWRPGFAGNTLGFDGDESITIGVIDTGVDSSHPDLADRLIDWKDFTSAQRMSPGDKIEHGTAVASILVGSGEMAGAGVERLDFTDSGFTVDTGDSWIFIGAPVSIPDQTPVFHLYKSSAHWRGGTAALLTHFRRSVGTEFDWVDMNLDSFGLFGQPLGMSNRVKGIPSRVYSPVLFILSQSVGEVVLTSTIFDYPGVDDFNKLRGVAPACQLAVANVLEEESGDDFIAQALDDMVLRRNQVNDRGNQLNIKVINLSLGLSEISSSLRQKANTTAENGILLVTSAGNSGFEDDPEAQTIKDPGRSALALTVGACNDRNQLTQYSSLGFEAPSRSGEPDAEDYKPDVIAPGGSEFYTEIMCVDSGDADGFLSADKQWRDYRSISGTSASSPFVAGCAALVIDALQQRRLSEGVSASAIWDYDSNQDVRFVKMVLCATATETGLVREDANDLFAPPLQRAAPGPLGFPAGKDPYEGYGVVNADAAVEAVYLDYLWGQEVSDSFGESPKDRRAWARTIQIDSERPYEFRLTNPETGDFDLYIYSSDPSPSGTPQLLAYSTEEGLGVHESINMTFNESTTALLIIKRVSGSGIFFFVGSGS